VEYRKIEIRGSTSFPMPLTLSDTYYQPAVYATIAQPLLLNAFGILDRFAENSARMKLQIAELQAREQTSADLNRYRKLYFQWITSRQVTGLILDTIQNARTLDNQIARKFATGLADNDDRQKTLSHVLQQQELHNRGMMHQEAIENELNIVFQSTRYAPDMNEVEKYSRVAIAHTYQPVPFEKTRANAIISLSVKNLKYARYAAKNRALPEMNIFGTVKKKSQVQDSSESYQYSEMNDTDYSVGFIFSYPLGSNTSEGEVTRISAIVGELEKEYEIAKNNYTRTLDTVITLVDGNIKILALKQQNIKALKSRLATEKRKYSQARLNLAYVIETENKIVEEEINILNLKNQLIELYFDYNYLVSK
jgi:outer membrane protein TolC